MSDALDATSQQAFTATTPDGPIAGSVQGIGAPLLLLHGGPAMSDYMELLAPELTGWRWVRYQQRGLAPSAPDGPFTVERHVADAVAVLDEAGIDRAVVLGHSWGGYLALNLALAHPDRVTGLVIVDPLGAVGDGGVAEMGQNLGSRLLPSAVEKYGEIAAKLATEPTDDAMLESLKLLWPGYYADPPTAPPLPSFMRASVAAYGGTFGSVSELQAGGLTERLRAIDVPAVFVLGEKSPMPVSQGEATAALLSRAEVRVVPAAGHLPWHEQPGCVAAALARVGELTGVS
jgi:pimeloyl-ACP methyl ester carboxylesterase